MINHGSGGSDSGRKRGNAMERIPVYIQAGDPISRAGLASQLRPRPEVRLGEDAERHDAAGAILVTGSVGDGGLRGVRGLRGEGIPRLGVGGPQVDDGGLGGTRGAGGGGGGGGG